MNRPLLAVLLLIATLQSELRSGDTLFIYIDASKEENADVQQAANLLEHDPGRAKELLLDVIERKPNHELANALLARVLLKEGDAKAALQRITGFVERGDASLHSLWVAIEIAKALGDEILVLKCLRLEQVRYGHMNLRNGIAEDWRTTASIAELLGRPDEAISLLTPVRDDRPSICVVKLWRLGQLKMHRGEYQQARGAITAAISEANRSMPDWCPSWD